MDKNNDTKSSNSSSSSSSTNNVNINYTHNNNTTSTNTFRFPGHEYSLSLIKTVFSNIIKTSNNVPQHIGFIMDGNRRYARKSGIPISEGHEAGFHSMSQILELCYSSGVKVATVYAFSIENFKRSSKEVNNLMKLAHDGIRQLCENGQLANKYGVRIRVIGDLSLLNTSLLKDIELTTKMTRNNKRATLNICFPYTSREEMFHSMKEIIESTRTNGEVKVHDIDESLIGSHLYTGKLPPLDLLVRTSGVCRLSDFMVWQVVNPRTHIELIDCLWPEFGPMKMAWILLKYSFNKYFASIENEDEDTIINNNNNNNHTSTTTSTSTVNSKLSSDSFLTKGKRRDRDQDINHPSQVIRKEKLQ